MSGFYRRKSLKNARQKTWFFALLTPPMAARNPFRDCDYCRLTRHYKNRRNSGFMTKGE
jgi:hypothetical protein